MAPHKEENDGVELRAWRSLADTYRTVHAEVNSDLRQYGLTLPQYSLMRIVGKSETGSLEMNEVAKELIVTLANVTMIADNLERQGYLKRVRGLKDRRVVTVELTLKGSTLWKKISAAHKSKVTGLMKGLSDAELRELTAYTDKVRERIRLASDTKGIDPSRNETKNGGGRPGRKSMKRPSEAVNQT